MPQKHTTRNIWKSEEEWRKILTPKQYRILREKGTEPPFSGEYTDLIEEGMYHCAACGAELFPSDTKFHSDSGWPSFYAPVSDKNVELAPDSSRDMQRTEIVCARCGSHLGHVFDDGPKPTGKRYCINSLALKFSAQGGSAFYLHES